MGKYQIIAKVKDRSGKHWIPTLGWVLKSGKHVNFFKTKSHARKELNSLLSTYERKPKGKFRIKKVR